MKKLTLGVLCLVFLSAFGLTCSDLATDSQPQAGSFEETSAVRVASTGLDHLTLSFSYEEPAPAEVEVKGRMFTDLITGKLAAFGDEGAPAIGYFGAFFAIPQGAKVEVEI